LDLIKGWQHGSSVVQALIDVECTELFHDVPMFSVELPGGMLLRASGVGAVIASLVGVTR